MHRNASRRFAPGEATSLDLEDVALPEETVMMGVTGKALI